MAVGHDQIYLGGCARSEVLIEDAPVCLQRALPPGDELVLQILVEATDGTGAGRHSHQGLSGFSDLMGTCSSHEHLGEALGHLRGCTGYLAYPLKKQPLSEQ